MYEAFGLPVLRWFGRIPLGNSLGLGIFCVSSLITFSIFFFMEIDMFQLLMSSGVHSGKLS